MKKFKRLLALVMAVTMLAGMVPANVMPVEAMSVEPANAEQTQTTVAGTETRDTSEVVDAAIFFSDLHSMYNGDTSEGSNGYKKDVVTNMMTALKNTGLSFSSVTSVGDAFSSNSTAYTGKTSIITGYIRDALGNQEIPVNYTWSDHDRAALAENDKDLLENKSGLIYGAGADGIYGNEDDGNYYIYAISMSDTSSAERYNQASTFTTQKLQDFKDAVDNLDKSKPLFIASHQPLLARRGDNQYAYQWCTVINEVAETRDVAFFFGHNHNYDKAEDYYYAKGDTMTVQKDNSTEPVLLNFTHMCTGYLDPATTGYAGDSRQGTVMLVTMYDDAINYTTYSASGEYTGKNAVNETVKRDYAVTEPEVVPADKTELKTVITAAETLVAEDYVDFTAVAEALAAAKTVAADESATQEAVDAAVTALNEAVDALEIKPEDTEIPEGYVLTHIEVVNTGVTKYFLGDELDTSKLKVEAVYTKENETDKRISISPVTESNTDGYTISGYDMGLVGKQNVTVTYNSWVENFEIEVFQKTFTAGDVTVECVTPGITALTATSEVKSVEGYLAYVTYDITPEGYIQGEETTVTVAVDTTLFDATRSVKVLDQGNCIATTNIVDGKVTFTTNHFSEYDIVQADEEVLEWKEIPGEDKNIFRITNSLTSGKKYVIVSTNQAGNAKAVNYSSSISTTDVVVIEDSKGNYIDAPATTAQWTYNSSSKFANVSSTNRYLYLAQNGWSYGLGITSQSNTFFTSWTYSDDYGLRTTQWNNSNGYYLYSDFTVDSSTPDSNERVHIYEETTMKVEPSYVAMTGSNSYILNLTEYKTSEEVKTFIRNAIDVHIAKKADKSDAVITEDYILEGTVTIEDEAESTLVVKYGNVSIGEIKVEMVTKNVASISVSPKELTVERGSSKDTVIGIITVIYEDGSSKNVDLTLGMLDEETYNIKENGTYDVSVTYAEKTTSDLVLKVVDVTGNNYPEYPDAGAVKVNKTATGIDFQSSGVAQIELSASGVPIKKGVDVILMLDTSSSMTKDENKISYEDGTSKKRSEVLEESLEDLIAQFKTPGEDGELLDIRVAIADFNGYYGHDSNGTSNTPYDRTSGDYVRADNGTGSGYQQASEAQVYTGSKALDKDAFVSVENLADSYTLNYTSGTNYDYAFDAIYQLGTAIKTANTEERDLYVIFMSDGAALQWNYFGSQNDYDKWNNWLTGAWDADDLTTSNLNSTAHSYFYDLNDHDGDGHINEHRMANAIKGEPSNSYEVIRKSTAGLPEGTLTEVEGKEYLYTVPGLGATMYTINFDAKQDGDILEENIDTALSSTASDSVDGAKYYYKITKAEELATAFNNIGTEISYAATNARFVDQMGDDFNLQMEVSKYTVVNEDKTTTEKTIVPTIEIITYDIYTKAEADANKIPAGMSVGDRKGTSALQEVVMFSEDGTKVYSNLIDVDKDGVYGVSVSKDSNNKNVYTLADPDDNILGADGIIYAKTFIYNTNITGVAVEGVKIPTGNGTETINVLPSETFYWKMGTVQTKELAMRYYVYLEGSMQGQKEAGAYPTNEYAILYYDNYLGNAAQKPTISPTMAWKSANVSYAFYLVNADGEIIVNQTTGQTGSFANKVAVTNPVVYKEILLNNKDQVQSIDVAAISGDVLPKYYTLYDEGAKYAVTINSNSTGSWEITNGGKEVNSTYVTHFTDNASAYSNALQNSTVGNDYTHTIVWFAVVWNVQAHPDTVVIDYGLPVDISVLTNDMFGDNGKLAGVGPYAEKLDEIAGEQSIQSGFGSTYSGTKYGSAAVNADKVRYTPAGMEMNGYDKFAYAVNYTGTENSGYYYDSVTVIPATTIYYEDSFVEYDSLVWQQKAGGQSWEGDWAIDSERTESIWSQVGTTVAGATQQEDRPGQYSITDANNIYGYDTVNKKMSTYSFSLGSAKVATVDYDHAAQASFKFWGTGFDVISMTDNTTGVIFVEVYQVNTDGTCGENPLKSYTVDTYYGYKKVQAEDEDGNLAVDENGDPIYEWVVDDDASNSIYQVPVMKIDNLAYGHYKAVIRAIYEPAFDHVDSALNGTYDFYLDAIRIYDPAGDGIIETATGNDNTILNAYKADHEGWPSYLELRNQLITSGQLGGIYGTDDPDTENDDRTVVTGLVFIDGDPEVGQADISDYMNYGPNNEVYIAPGQRVAFMLNTPANIDKIHIGLKSADGKVGTYTITNIAKANSTDGKVTAGDYYNARTFTIDTATDMYYDLTGWKGDIIVISNTGDRYSTDGVISITNIKSTYTSDPNANNGVATASLDEEFTGNETSIYMTPAAAMLTLRTLNMPEEEIITPDEEVTTPEVEIFAPEKLEVKVHKDKVKTGEKVKVTVTTSSDVEAIEINGSEITNFKAAKHGDRKWETNIIAEEAGTLEITVTAKNADGNSSEEITSFVEVTRKVFKPRKLDVKLQKNKAKAGQKLKVTVTTSSDVEVIEINGNEITNFKAKGIHERTWETTITAEEAGKMNVSVVAKDKDGNLSAPVTKIVEVTKKHGK